MKDVHCSSSTRMRMIRGDGAVRPLQQQQKYGIRKMRFYYKNNNI